jgi:hypothetical protein
MTTQIYFPWWWKVIHFSGLMISSHIFLKKKYVIEFNFKIQFQGNCYGPEGESQSLRLTGSFYYFLVYYIVVRCISF